jgi:drug/metabolite transporter (DMT)-like permease
LSFVFATFAAVWFLDERVSSIRWTGVVLIMIGAALISYSQQMKEKPAKDPAPTHISPKP